MGTKRAFALISEYKRFNEQLLKLRSKLAILREHLAIEVDPIRIHGISKQIDVIRQQCDSLEVKLSVLENQCVIDSRGGGGILNSDNPLGNDQLSTFVSKATMTGDFIGASEVLLLLAQTHQAQSIFSCSDEDVILAAATLYQRGGIHNRATSLLKDLVQRFPDYESNNEVIVCFGKLLTQAGRPIGEVRDYIGSKIGSLDKPDQTRLLNALTWRLVLFEQLSNPSRARDMLEEHFELSEGQDYQIAHNRWCNALHCILSFIKNPLSRIPYLEFAESYLTEAKIFYSSQADFPFYAKCLASNLILWAWIAELKRNPGRSSIFKMGAWILFRYGRVLGNHEAMSEIIPVVSPHFEAISSVFADDFVTNLLNVPQQRKLAREAFEIIQVATVNLQGKSQKQYSDTVFDLVTKLAYE